MKMKTAPNGKIKRHNNKNTPHQKKNVRLEQSAKELSRIRLKLNAFPNFRGIAKFSGAPEFHVCEFSCFANAFLVLAKIANFSLGHTFR
jgi:hypothetical protein